MGFEVPDVLAIFLLLSILNYLFGQTNYKLAFVWAPVAIAATILRIGKRGKPDGFLMHALKFYLSPGELWAGKWRKNK